MKVKIMLDFCLRYSFAWRMVLVASTAFSTSCMRTLMNPYSVIKNLQNSGEFSFKPCPDSMYFLIPIEGEGYGQSNRSASLKVEVDGATEIINITDLATFKKTNWLNSKGIDASVIVYAYQFRPSSKMSNIKFSLIPKSGNFELWLRYGGIRGDRPTMSSHN